MQYAKYLIIILFIKYIINHVIHSSIDVGSKSEIELANISMLVMKRQLVGGGHSDWSTPGVSVMLPDQTSLTGRQVGSEEDVVSVSFTKYNNLGRMMNDKSSTIRYLLNTDIYCTDI